MGSTRVVVNAEIRPPPLEFRGTWNSSASRSSGSGRHCSDRIANARVIDELDAERRERAIAEAPNGRGQLDVADAVRELDPSDAAALGELGVRRLELEEHYERDDLEDDRQSS